MKHDYLTVVSVYGHNDGSSSIPSLLKSTAALPGSRGLLLSINKPISLPEHIAWKKIPALTYQQYSLFMIYCLASFIETDFTLCVQSDSWVLNENAWIDDFLEYDYIGAPTEIGLIEARHETDPGFRLGGMLLRAEGEWLKEDNPIGVFNGGFSLRSKKFLNAPREMGLPYVFDDNSIRQNEDLQLCLFMRSQLMAFGIKFPPINVAKNFAFEHYLPDLHSSFELEGYFGIHGSYMRLVGFNQIELIRDKFTPEVGYHWSHQALKLIKAGYQVI